MRPKEEHKRVKPFYNPPYLLLKQTAAIMSYAWLTGWNKRAFLRWAGQVQNLIHAGAGTHQICCFGVNPHVVWEMTGRCNLKCIHCHAFGGEASHGLRPCPPQAPEGLYDELSKEEGMALIDQIAASGIRTFVFTGGEPLMREDVHLNIVASTRNFDEIERIIDYGDRIGVYSYFIYNFVPCGRGEAVRDNALGNDDFKALLDLIFKKQREVRAILIPVAAPEYWAYVLQRRGIHSKRLIRFLGHFIGGCLADKGMVYIKPNGDVWACPFLPVQVGNVRKESIEGIWGALNEFRCELGETECNGCEYVQVCSGCKAKMMGDSNYTCPVNERARTNPNRA